MILIYTMKKLILIAIILALGWYGNYLYKQHGSIFTQQSLTDLAYNNTTNTTKFKCDGRTYCSQMTSCEEATFFLRNCPNVKMDGNNDGVPCEKQWCR
jgi:hypothetical protein